MKSDREKEIKHLEQLIITGSKIRENTSNYKRELAKLKKAETQKSKSKQIVVEKKKTKLDKTQIKKALIKKASLYNIQSVTTNKNSIIINFNRNINKNSLKFFELHSNNTHKDVFDIKGTFEYAYKTKLKINNVKAISVGQFKPKILRISITNDYNLKTIYIINKRQIIIKILDITLKEKVVNALIKPFLTNKNRTIVIDPGHGGKDAGAVGKSRRYEKIVVLKVSKYLHKILKDRGYKVYLTRTNDKYIELKKRTEISNDRNADIFISIHTNAIGKAKANTLQGIETFFLSPARSSRAKRIAALENKSDMNAMNNNSQMSFLTVLNQSKITASNKMAIDIQQNLLYSARQLYKDVVDGGVREGPFWVLVGAQMPSVLVELGYISHPKEAQRLFTTRYQKQLALGLANGIDAYFSKNLY